MGSYIAYLRGNFKLFQFIFNIRMNSQVKEEADYLKDTWLINL